MSESLDIKIEEKNVISQLHMLHLFVLPEKILSDMNERVTKLEEQNILKLKKEIEDDEREYSKQETKILKKKQELADLEQAQQKQLSRNKNDRNIYFSSDNDNPGD